MRATLLLLALCHANLADAQAWLRVENPSAAVRANVPAGAIDYGGFIWMPAEQAPIALLGARVQRVEQPFHMLIDGQWRDPRATRSADPWLQPAAHSGPDFRLVQLFGPPRAADLDELRAAHVRPVRYLAPYSYIVWASQAELANLSARSGAVRWVGDFLPGQRVPPQSRDLGSQITPAMALIDADSASAVLAVLAAVGAQVVKQQPLTPDLTLVELQLPGDRFLQVAAQPGVFTLQRIPDDAGPRSEMTNQSIVGAYNASNVITPGYLNWLNPTGLTGAGVKVSIVDGGIRTTHTDLANNMVACVGGSSCSTANDSHGTHVAGAVAGNATTAIRDAGNFLRGQGVAPGASLIQQRYGPFLSAGGPGGMVVDGMLSIYKDAALSGAQLANNSWGPSSVPQGYDIPTMQVDMIARDANPDAAGSQPILTVWSIMNGNGDRNSGICAPSSLGSPDEAKNLFAIGSTKMLVGGVQSTAIFDVSSNSAHGQACDGRQVPHIVAPGCSTDSTTSASNTSFGSLCGTSMASPVVSGASALYWQRYRNQQSREPSPALIKAVFTAVAKNLTGFLDADGRVMPQRPNRFSGWGRLDLDAVINPGVSVWLIDQTEVLTSSGSQFDIQLEIADPSKALRIMLAWTDAPGPGTGGTTASWTNDLDLNVSVGALTYRGNVFNAADGFSMSGGSADAKNNLEGVVLSPAQHGGGAFGLNVLAATIAADALNPWIPSRPRQDFAIACYNCRVVGGSPNIFADGFDGQSPIDDLFANGFE